MKLFHYLAWMMLVCNSVVAQNTGIGLTNPQSKLHILRGASGYFGPYPHQDLILESNDNTWINFLAPNNKEMGILFGKPSHIAHGGLVYDINNNLQFRTNGNVLRMSLTAGGNLGIGTITPSARLEVQHTSALSTPTLKLYENASSGFARLHFQNAGSGIKFWEIAANTDDAVQANSQLSFSHLNAGNVLNLRGDGRIGIGTVFPSARLDIRHNNDIGNPTLLLFDNSTAGNPTIQFQNAGGGENWQITAFVNNSSISQSELVFQNTTGQHLNIRGNGNLGIGIVPSYKLDVNGDLNVHGPIRFNGAAGTAGQVLVSNGSSAPSWAPVNSNPQVGFLAYLADDINIDPNIEYLLTAYLESFDDGNVFNPSTGEFIAPSSGLYHLEALMSWNSPPSGNAPFMLRLISGNGLVTFGQANCNYPAHPGYTLSISNSINVKMNAGDKIKVVVLHNAAATLTLDGTFGSTRSKFSGFKVY